MPGQDTVRHSAGKSQHRCTKAKHRHVRHRQGRAEQSFAKLRQGYVGYRGVKQGQDKVKLARYGTGIVRFCMATHGQSKDCKAAMCHGKATQTSATAERDGTARGAGNAGIGNE